MEGTISFIIQYIIPFAAVIGVVVFVHEFGHYITARLCGVRILSFSIGFGPKLFGWKDKHGTQWQVAAFPLGGYVKMFGDADPASTPDNETLQEMSEEDKKYTFFFKSVWQRIAIVASGPAFNYLFAIVVLACSFSIIGKPYAPPVISSVMEDSVAASAGLLVGDRIVSIDGKNMKTFDDVRRTIALNSGTPVVINLERENEILSFTLTPELAMQSNKLGGENKMGRIGIMSQEMEVQKLSPFAAVTASFYEVWKISSDTITAVSQMISGTRGTEEIGGPLRIAEMSGKIAQNGVWAMLWFMALISVNLGLVNLLPIPLLDGGHLLYYIAEAITGKPLNEKVQQAGFVVGIMFVASLMLFATWNDLVQMEVVSSVANLFS
ncbi:MAG: RIP metalloprotease RseP [Alphaproteobacteria bacterium]|nr:RIP metalloprotease RseP [Alphaproteobacteria bacterium]